MRHLMLFSAGTVAALGLIAAGPVLAQVPECEGVPSDTRLLIEVDQIPSSKGHIATSLYPGDKSQFLIKNGALKVWYAPVTLPVTHMCIYVKHPGTYAVVIYHDGNDNHKPDHSLFGYSERAGASNNPHLFFAAPTYESSKFQAKTGDTTLRIHLQTGKS